MRNYRAYYLLFVITILTVSLLTGCLVDNTPPNVSSVEKQFQNNYNAIQTIIEFIINTGYNNIYIQDSEGTMMADLKDLPIGDDDVLAAVQTLFKGGYYINISKIDNTITFLQWRGTKDIGCGIAYSINGVDAPEVQFMTKLVSLSEDGWFYYVSDYNTWRSGRNLS